jgi:hypothetical protein
MDLTPTPEQSCDPVFCSVVWMKSPQAGLLRERQMGGF